MNINDFKNLPYRHRESNELYTLILVGNTTATKVDQDIENPAINSWVPRAVFRKHSTGEIFIRPHEEFLEKFEMYFPELEQALDSDLDYLADLTGELSGSGRTRRRLTVMSAARALWTLFPLISETSRIDLIRGLNLSDFTEKCKAEELEKKFSGRAMEIARMLNTVTSALKLPESSERLLKNELPNVDDNLALIMLALVQSYNEYIFMVSVNHPAENEEAQNKIIEDTREHVKGICDTAAWLEQIGVKVALPAMPVNLRFFNPAEAEEVLTTQSN